MPFPVPPVLNSHNRMYVPYSLPNAVGSPERIRSATTHMDRGGTQAAMKAVVEQCGIKKKSRSTH